jgi:putative flavoprotein involved in K+ transport
LANVARVTLATRKPIRFQRQQIFGQDVFLWVNRIGFDRIPLGHLRRLQEPAVVIDFGLYKAALRQGKLDRRPVFPTFTPEGVQWSDGSVEQVDTVLFATGYRSNLGYLEKLGALDEVGEPIQRAGVSLAVAGLYFVGLTGQRTLSSATLRGVGADAGYVVAHARRYLAATNNDVAGSKHTNSPITR